MHEITNTGTVGIVKSELRDLYTCIEVDVSPLACGRPVRRPRLYTFGLDKETAVTWASAEELLQLITTTIETTGNIFSMAKPSG